VAKSAGLPAGTQHWVLELYASARHGASEHEAKKKPAPPSKPILIHFFVAPDGARTWMAIGGNDVETAGKLAATLSSGANGGLASRPELASLKDAKIGSGGFIAVRAFPEMIVTLPVLMGGWLTPTGAAADLDEVDRMPSKGATPIVFTVTPQAPGGPGSLTATTFVPRGAVEDLVYEFVRHGL
jgi:hypothetical protein